MKKNVAGDQLKAKFPGIACVVGDKRVKDGCSKRRPDLFLDMGCHIVIIEVHENKHDVRMTAAARADI